MQRRTDFNPSPGKNGLKSVLRPYASVPGGVGKKSPHREPTPLPEGELCVADTVPKQMAVSYEER
jgi:hypothetical protein